MLIEQVHIVYNFFTFSKLFLIIFSANFQFELLQCKYDFKKVGEIA